MKNLCLLLLVCVACGTKKPPAKPSTPPPPAEEGAKPDESKPAPAPTAVPRTGDPCDGGQKPH